MKKLFALFLACCMVLSFGTSYAAFTALEDDENIVRIGLFADSHVLDDSSAINNAITAFESLDQTLDGIVMGGDIVANAPTELLPNLYDAALMDAKLGEWLNKKPSVSNETRVINGENFSVGTSSGNGALVWVMGNHEFHTNGNDEAARALAWGKFQEKTGFGIRGNVTMGGYRFIYSAAGSYDGQYTDAEQEWMLEELKNTLSDESYGQKPVFLVLHHAIPDSYKDTTNGVNGSNFIAGKYSDEFISYVKSQPRIIEFSAHTHYPIQDPRMIRQPSEGGFTTVQIPFAGNGSFTLDRTADIRTASQEDSYAQALMMEIDKTTNVVTIKRLNTHSGEFIGNDWKIDVAALINGEGYNYTDARYNNGKAPEFSEGEVTAAEITDKSAVISFPAATKYSKETETDYAHLYNVKVVKKISGVVELKKSIVSDYYKLSQADCLTLTTENLEPQTEYIVSITAVSPYGKESKAVTGEFTTKKETPAASESDIVLDAESEIVKAGILGKDGDHYVAWIDGTTPYVTWEITPTVTGVYDLSVLASFTKLEDSVDRAVTLSIDGKDLTTVAAGSDSLTEPAEHSFGSMGLVAGNTYTLKMTYTGTYYTVYWYNTKLTYKHDITENDEAIYYKTVTAGVDDIELVGLSLAGDNRWQAWLGGDIYYAQWSFTPQLTGMYSISSVTSFGTSTPVGELKVGMYIDDFTNPISTIVPEQKGTGIATSDTLNFGEVFLMAGNTYTVGTRIYGMDVLAYLHSATIRYAGAATDEILKEEAVINIRSNDLTNVINHNTTSINDSRFHWWNGEGKAFIEWSVTPVITGVYEISSLSGYATTESTTQPTLEALIDNSRVGVVCEPAVMNGSNTSNLSVFGEVLLEAEKTYTLRLNLGGTGYNVYLDSVKVCYSRAAEDSDYWIDTVVVNGYEPSEKYVAGLTENYGVIISQANHYASYKVAPGEGFFRLKITYGVNFSADTFAPLTLKVNGKDMGSIKLTGNGCYWPNANKEECVIDLGVIKLNEGENTITFGHTGGSDKYYSIGKVTVEAIKEPVYTICAGEYADMSMIVAGVCEGNMTAYIRLPRNKETKNIKAVFAVYEKDGSGSRKLIGVSEKTVVADASGEDTLTVYDIVKNEGFEYDLKVIYLESFESLKPIF